MVGQAGTAVAQGGGLGGIPSLPGTVSPGGDIRAPVISLLEYVLSFLALLAVIVIVVAGIRLITSQGEEQAKEKAKKTILNTIIGLLVVLFARVIVALVADLPTTVNL